MSEVKKNHLWGFEEFAKAHPECIENGKRKKNSSDTMRFMCQCKKGHIFDYRNRELYPPENKHYAPCQGKCPVCGCSQFSFVDEKTYPIKWKFLGD